MDGMNEWMNECTAIVKLMYGWFGIKVIVYHSPLQ